MGDDTPGKITASRRGRTGSVRVSAIDHSSWGAGGLVFICWYRRLPLQVARTVKKFRLPTACTYEEHP
jgi:hypothetical protein